MRKTLTYFLSLALGFTIALAGLRPSAMNTSTYPIVTIHDIQFDPLDSLLKADTLGYSTGSFWTLQTSSYMNDTVTIVALVTVPPKVISYTNDGLTLAVVDTGVLGTQPWGGILVRYPNINDTIDFGADGYFNVKQGDVIEMTGVVIEFPLNQMNSATQFDPIPGIPVQILSSGNPLPPPVHLTISDFNIGPNPGGQIMFSTGEQWESKYVYLTNVTVVGNVNVPRGTFSFTDGTNQLSDYDLSYHFTASPSAQAQPTTPADTNYKVPPAGTSIDTIRGYICTSSGGESARGYRIGPMFPGDIVYSEPSVPILNSPTSGSLNQSLLPVFNWSGNAASYHLQVAKDSLFTLIVYDNSAITTNSIQVNALQSNTIYYWHMNGQNITTSSQWSPTWHFTTHSLTSPNLVSPMNGALNQPLPLTLSWSAPPFVSTYRLQVATDSNYSTITFDSSAITATSEQLGSLLGNTTYYWHVMSVDSGIPIAWSVTWRFTLYSLPPSNISPLAGNRKITLTWLASSSPNTSKYKIYRGTSSSTLAIHDSTSNTSYVDTGLTNGTKYFYEITTENNLFLEGPVSLEVNATPFNQSPHAVSLQNVYEPNAGSVPLQSLGFSSSGSSDPDGTIDSVFWFINGNLVSKQQQLVYNFAQGTTQVRLIVQDNQGARDSSFATVTISMFKVSLNGPVYAGPSLLGDNVLYVIGTGDAIYRMDGEGNILYSLQVGGDVRSSSSIAFDTTVYIASSDKNLYAFSKYGNAVWEQPLGGVLTSTPAIDSARNQLYIGVSNKNFVAINRSTGIATWNYFASAPILGSAAVTLDGKLIFATSVGTIYGFDLNNLTSPPTPTWQLNLSDSVLGSSAVDPNGDIYYCTAGGKVVKVSMQRGLQATTIWQAQANSRIVGSPVIDGTGTLYVGCEDDNLYAINTQNGSIKWMFNSGSPIESTPAISNVNLIYFGNDGGKVYALDTSSTLRWFYQDSTAIQAPLLYQNGTLYVGTVGGRILAFYDAADSAALSSTRKQSLNKSLAGVILSPVWGTFQGNNQRTGMPAGKTITAVLNKTDQIPTIYSLSQNFPNPFNPSTTLQYSLPITSHVSLRIYNVLGQVVAQLVEGEQVAGWYEVKWNANASTGIYFYQIDAVSIKDPNNQFVQVKKMLLLK